DGIRIHPPSLVHGDARDVDPVQAVQVLRRLEDRLVLDGRRDDVAPGRARGPRRAEHDPLDGEVVRLGAAGGEDDVAGPYPQHCRHAGARIGESVGGRLADRVVAGRIAERAGEERKHRLQHLRAHRGGGGVVEVAHAQPPLILTSRPRSSARAEWVSAPTEITSTPVSAIARTVSRVTPPDASTTARPAICSTAARRSSIEKLSSMMTSTPPARTGSICSTRSSTTSMRVAWATRSRAARIASVTDSPRCSSTARWLSLAITASDSELR